MILELLERLQGVRGLYSQIQSASKDSEKLRQMNTFAKQQFSDETLTAEALKHAAEKDLPPEAYTDILRLFSNRLLANVVSQRNSEDVYDLIDHAFAIYQANKITLEPQNPPEHSNKKTGVFISTLKPIMHSADKPLIYTADLPDARNRPPDETEGAGAPER